MGRSGGDKKQTLFGCGIGRWEIFVEHLLGGIHHQSEPIAVVPHRGDVAAAVADGATIGRAADAAPSQHTEFATLRSSGVGLRLRAVEAYPVGTPLAHIPTHIIEAQLVREFLTHRMGAVGGIDTIPGVVLEMRAVVAGEDFAGGEFAPTGGILPFCLGGQTETVARDLAEAGDEDLHVVPRDLLHGEAVVAYPFGRILAHHGKPEALRHLELSDIEIVDSDLVGGELVGIAAIDHQLVLIVEERDGAGSLAVGEIKDVLG